MPPFLAALARSRRMPLFAALLAAGTLAGCGGSDDGKAKFAPSCPEARLLSDASDLTRMRGAGTDVTDLVLRGRIIAIQGSCGEGSRGVVRSKVQVLFDITRGPASTARKAELPYLVTVMRGETILDQQLFTVVAEFPENVDRVRLGGEEIDLALPVSGERQASDYKIYVSFRLTAAELAYNRRTVR